MEPIAPKLILVPTDFSAPSAQALRYGAAIAERFSAHLLVVYADPFVLPVDVTIAVGTFSVPRQDLVDAAREQLQTFVEANVPSTVPYDVRVVVGLPVDSIVAQASETGADLIVMGTHGRTGLRRWILGSVSEAVMRLAPAPVIVVHESSNVTSVAQRIVGCVMPSRESRAALRHAETFAGDTARFVLFGSPSNAGRPFTMDCLHLLQVLTPAELLGHTSFKLAQSVSSEDVLAEADADRADLIVLGIDKDRDFSDVLRGTMAERVVQHSACPVLTVNHFAAARMLGAEAHEHHPALSA